MLENNIIQKSLAMAFHWDKLINENPEINLSIIADQEKLSVRYVRQIYKLNYLMPDIIEALMNGHNPNNITFKEMKTHIPMLWSEQYIWFFGK